MNPYKEYISKIENEKYADYHDIEDIDIKDIRKIDGVKFEVSYDFRVVSRVDPKWSLNRREKRIISLAQIRDERINQILDV